ncbi:MAG: toxic anion resistance protein [Clostridia bacterium]|nr:toxic anion resistance protein [Clostridia bacterium]
MGEFSQFALVPEQGVVPELAQLDEDMQSRIRTMAQRLDLQDGSAVAGFGARAQKEMAAFSDVALSRMLSRDLSDLSGTMRMLSEQISACSFASQAKGFFRRIFGGTQELGEVRAAYEKAEPKINACADEMTDRRVMLMRDSALLERLYERNEDIYRELCSLIVVGEEALRQAKERGEQAHITERLERRIDDIRVTQLSSTQLAAQIRMIQASDSATCDKLRTALEVTIPLWKSQMAAALGLARAADAMKMHSRMQRDAVRGMREGADELRAQTKAYHEAAARSDRERAEQTARELLSELERIETDIQSRRVIESPASQPGETR